MIPTRPIELDMTPDGRTVRRRLPVVTRVAIGAVILAVVAGAVALAALAIYVALLLIPIALVAGLVAWAAFRFQLWRARRGGPPRRDMARRW